ncbi:Gfo/Idh/MocA family oxidoreductase [Paraburkholderia sp. LEh10]|uniref:Gfo/Idh/MocA family protein n=1 Tax=Paraburkholderia sp. LEh10 TaxID=2821353 RepID=UPI001AEAAEEB|nr:Gfo/Idh/MocA family oxidoreductase [Paraburkholderia sp. LEh10]MBP0588584.1 Gfo/Idh/MocA family oxidoreductase [Paraburkholderia sp. LEh10]
MSAVQSNQSVEPIRVGLVGIGNWALHGHVRVLKMLPQYRLRALWSTRADAAHAAADAHGIEEVVGSLDDLVDHPEVDLVVVLNTAPQHAQTVRKAIAAGKHVYCEWPLSVSTQTSQELVEMAQRAGVRHIVGLQRRLAPHNRYLRDLVQSGFVGKLRSVRIHVSMDAFGAQRSQALRWTVPAENFSSAIAIYAGHFLDMLFASVGWPQRISALALNQIKTVTIRETGEVLPSAAPDQLMFIGRMAGDAALCVHVEAGKLNGRGVRIDITGDAGDLRITNASAFGDVGDDYVIEGACGQDMPMQKLAIPLQYDRLPASNLPSAVLELAELYVAYAGDLRTGSSDAPTFADAVRLHRLIDAAMRSTEEGREIALN